MRSASICLTAKQMLCSLLAWEIMMTFTLASLTALKMVLAVPGTPTIPVPCTKDWLKDKTRQGGGRVGSERCRGGPRWGTALLIEAIAGVVTLQCQE